MNAKTKAAGAAICAKTADTNGNKKNPPEGRNALSDWQIEGKNFK